MVVGKHRGRKRARPAIATSRMPAIFDDCTRDCSAAPRRIAPTAPDGKVRLLVQLEQKQGSQRCKSTEDEALRVERTTILMAANFSTRFRQGTHGPSQEFFFPALQH